MGLWGAERSCVQICGVMGGDAREVGGLGGECCYGACGGWGVLLWIFGVCGVSECCYGAVGSMGWELWGVAVGPVGPVGMSVSMGSVG